MSSDKKQIETNAEVYTFMSMDYATDASVRARVSQGLMTIAANKGKHFSTKLTDGCNRLQPLVNLIHKLQTEAGTWYIDGRDEHFVFVKTEGSTLPKKPTPEDVDTHRYTIEDTKIECGFVDLSKYGAVRVEGPVIYLCQMLDGDRIRLCGVEYGSANSRVLVPESYKLSELSERLIDIIPYCHRHQIGGDVYEFRISSGPATIPFDCMYIVEHNQRETVAKLLWEEVKRICSDINNASK